MKPVRTAVIPAGGLGTRFLPFSRAVPKELLPLVDTPVIDLVVSECAAAGIERIVLVVGPGKEALAAYFRPNDRLSARLVAEGRTAELAALRRPEGLAHVEVVVQEEARGNGHAVLVAREAVGDEPFALLWGDDIIMSAGEPALTTLLRTRARRGGGSVVGAVRVPREAVSRYGILVGEPDDLGDLRVSGIVEKPEAGAAPSDLAQVHGYVFEPEIFEVLASQPPGRGGEIWLSDAVTRLAARSLVWGALLGGTRYDAGDRAGYAAAFVDAALGREDTAPAVREALRAMGWQPPKLP
ncbi:MAG: UTP--glucose-1-phosphate uridylyltransferase [Chloroflexi bacterium]|nr:UTP--glucose-1-phosphate uridylyltransferase [Chloroflexota bacterium]